MTEPVGFVGLGAMGSRMAGRLVAGGVPLMVWSRSSAKADGVVALGARRAESLDALGGECRVILGCLLDDTAVHDVYTQLIATARPGQIFVEHGTFSPALARRMSRHAAAVGAEFVDAPITGGPEGAEEGTLMAMAGGDEAALAAAEPLLAHYVRAVRRVGGSGSGLDLKLINQLLVSIHLGAAAEAAALLTRLSIPPEVAIEVLGGGWAASAMLERELPRALAGDFEHSGATIGGLVHVQKLIATLFEEVGVPPRLLPITRELFAEATGKGIGDLDPAALVTVYEP